MRILIVEDECLIALALADSLEQGGHEVLGPAGTMDEALALCEATAQPDLAVLDSDLRDGSSGVDVARALLHRWGVLSIFASGQVAEARRAQDIAFGCISKPYHCETVLRSLEMAHRVIGGGGPEAVPAGLELFAAGR